MRKWNNAAMRTLATGLGLLESPRWRDGRLWVADWTGGLIRAIDLSAGHADAVRIVLEHHSLPMCFDFLPNLPASEGLVLTSSSERALLRPAADGTLVRHADLSALSPYAYNDIVIDGRGDIYVNNVNFDFAEGNSGGDPAPGFVALVTPDGYARLVADDLAFPNGMAVTADGGTLGRRRVVPAPVDGLRHRRRRFAVESPGVGGRGRSFTGRHLSRPRRRGLVRRRR